MSANDGHDPEAMPHDAPLSAAWWDALRRVTTRALDLFERAVRDDADFRRELGRLLAHRFASADAPKTEAAAAEPDLGGAAPDVADGSAAAPREAGAGAVSSPSPPMTSKEAATGAATPSRPAAPKPATPALLAPRLVAPAAPLYPAEWTRQPFEPAAVAAACRIKAEACRWQSERARRLDLGEDVSEGDREIVARARAMGAWLWMVSPNKWRERSEDAFAVVAGCYDALADAAELMALADQTGMQKEVSLRLLAEAQSSLRVAVEDYGSTRRDEDQESTFAWLRQETDARRVRRTHAVGRSSAARQPWGPAAAHRGGSAGAGRDAPPGPDGRERDQEDRLPRQEDRTARRGRAAARRGEQ